MSCRAAIGLGSNQGNPERNILAAASALEHAPGIEPQALSSGYRTEPLGPPQPDFLNAVMLIETELEPLELLAELLGIEAGLGRRRLQRFGPRVIDLDLLLMGDEVVDHPRLVLPHPRLGSRAFALTPLLEVWPDARYPRTGEPLAPILELLGEQVVGEPRPLPKRSGRVDLDHTADMAFSVSASSLEEVLEGAALALIDLMIDRRGVVERKREVIEVRGGDRVELMIALLEELVYLVDARGFAPRRASGLVLGDELARMAVYGEPLQGSEHLRQRVKAVTYHGAEVRRRRSDRWTASVVVDV